MSRRSDIKYINKNLIVPLEDNIIDERIDRLSTCTVDCNPTDEISIYDIANNLKEIIKHERSAK